MLILSVILALAVAVAIVFAKRILNGEDAVADNSYVVKACVIGVIVGVINYMSPGLEELAWLSYIFLPIMLLLYVWLAYWWKEEGSEWTEMIPFVVLVILFYFPAKAAAAVVSSSFESVGVISFMLILPALFAIGVVGFFVANLFYFLYSETDKVHGGDNTKIKQEKIQKANLRKTLSMVAGVITVLVLALVCWTGVDWSTVPDSAETDVEVAAATEPGEDARFVQDWTDNGNNRLDNEFAAKLANKAKAENGEITADIVEETVLENCGHDARMLAIWANAFNLWDDPNNYEPLLTSDKGYLSEEGIQLYYQLEGYLKATKIVREEAPADGTNTGYNDGYVVANSAGISGDRSGTKFTSPDKSVEPFWLMDRCSNFVYRNPPRKVPKGPTDEGKGDNPDGPKYNKDPNKAPKTDTEPNDDKGPGPDTNNPKDPNHSSKDTSDSSTSGSYDDYKKNVEEKKEVNQNQKTGGDSNTPSTPKPSPKTNVDNNADSGTGHGGIDTPTPAKPKAKEADSGKEINNKAGEAWEGPAD